MKFSSFLLILMSMMVVLITSCDDVNTSAAPKCSLQNPNGTCDDTTKVCNNGLCVLKDSVCKPACEDDQVCIKGACFNETRKVDCNENTPTNATADNEIKEKVSIAWDVDAGRWEAAADCAWTCDTSFKINPDETACIKEGGPCDGVECGDNSTCSETDGECLCDSGYQFDTEGANKCVDTDECRIATHDCSQLCTNTDGGFTCSCEAGYTLNDDGKTCDDIDECAIYSLNNCHHKAECTNNPGGFECECISGYEGDGLNGVNDKGCVGILACEDNPCEELGRNICKDENSDGTPECYCNEGFRLDEVGDVCLDINECFYELDNCSVHADCNNNVGGFECTCKAGYEGNGVICDDINECDDINDNMCQHTCVNTEPGFHCSCNDGYELDDDGKRCNDINECEDNNGYCETTCTNSVPGFECSCDDGYELNEDGLRCDNINECEDGNNGGCGDETYWKCKDNIGSFDCSCNTSYTGTDCTDCATGYHKEGAICVADVCFVGNTQYGTTACGLNDRGVLIQNCSGGVWVDGTTCNDPDECNDDDNQVGTTVCGLNNEGFLRQDCTNGAWVNNLNCTGTDICTNGTEQTGTTLCGLNNEGTLNQYCTSGEWVDNSVCTGTDICTNGSQQTGSTACGLNSEGFLKQDCTNGAWVNNLTCTGNDVCTNEDIRTGSTTCGLNDEGFLKQDCTNGAWVNNLTCTGTDICNNGTEQTGSTVCGLNNEGFLRQDCTSGAWVDNLTCTGNDVCTNGDTRTGSTACGLNNEGFLKQDCTVGEWVNNLTCTGTDICTNGTEQSGTTACGLNDRGVLVQNCTSGAWVDGSTCDDPDVCTDEDTSNQDCGLNDRGTQERTCITGAWGAWGTCTDPDACIDNTTQNISCTNGLQPQDCTLGEWIDNGTCLCSTGYQDNGTPGICSANCETANLNCGNHGTCNDQLGEAICICETGYIGTDCTGCADGYHDDGTGTCVADSCGDGFVTGSEICDSGDLDSWEQSCNVVYFTLGFEGYQGEINCNTCIAEDDSACYQSIVINEVMTGNGTGWIEIYNRGTESVDISGWHLDSMNHSFIIANGVSIVADGYYLVSSLNIDLQEMIEITDSLSNQVDYIDWTTDKTLYGRFANGTGDFQDLAIPTPGAANVNLESIDIDWCNVVFPQDYTEDINVATTIYGQVLGKIDGNKVTGGGNLAQLTAEACYDDNGTEVCKTAVYNPSCAACGGDNNEYMTDVSIPNEGSYQYYYKFSGDMGFTWTKCTDAGGSEYTATINGLGVDLDGYVIDLWQNGSSMNEYTLSGYYPHNTYIAFVRDSDDFAVWDTYFSTSIDSTTNNIIFFDMNNSAWQPNGDKDDSVHLFDNLGNELDVSGTPSDEILTRQSDGSYLVSNEQHVAIDAPMSIDGYTSPLYIYELGDAGGTCDLTNWRGNYALIYIP